MTISQVLKLEDRVSPSFKSIAKTAEDVIRTYDKLDKKQTELVRIQAQIRAEFGENNAAFKQADKAVLGYANQMKELVNTGKVTNEMKKLTDETNRTADAFDRLGGIARKVIAVLSIRKLASMSDRMVQTNARLGLLGENIDVNALNSQVYASAQRSRVDYMSMADNIAKLGMQAADAFKNAQGQLDTNQIIAFNEGLNKLFTTSGMDQGAISSVMYNLTQSMSTGHLLGNDYRILKMNSPKIIELLRKTYADGSQEALDKMVSKGQISAQMLKNAILGNLKDIEAEFEKMPVTFGQAWTKFTNTMTKLLIPVLNLLSGLAQKIDAIFTFLSNNEYILWIILGVLTAIIGPILLYNSAIAIATTLSKIYNTVLTLMNSQLGLLYLKFILIVGIIAIVVGVLIYLWNTNDKVAYGMLYIWDMLGTGLQMIVLGIKAAFYGLLDGLGYMKIGALGIIDGLINGAIDRINDFISLINKIPGVSIDLITFQSHMATDAIEEFEKEKSKRDEEISRMAQDIWADAAADNITRQYRVDNRNKVGIKSPLEDTLSSVIGTDSFGDTAIKTTSNDQLLKDEDIQLLLDVATRDYKLNYQQITPEISLTFTGDMNQQVDADYVIDVATQRMVDAINGDLGVASVNGL